MPKESGVMIAIAPSGRPPALGAPGQPPKPPAPRQSPAMPADEPDGDEGAIPPNPEAVDFRPESETCGHCTYMEGDHCTHPIVNQTVGPGDSCAAFEAAGEQGMGMEMGEQVPETQEAEYAQ